MALNLYTDAEFQEKQANLQKEIDRCTKDEVMFSQIYR